MADYEDTKVTDLVINNMSQEKFEELKAAGELDPTQIYLTPTEASGDASLPDQTGNEGKFLQTNGSEASWQEALVNQNQNGGIGIGNTQTISSGTSSISIGNNVTVNDSVFPSRAVAIGNYSSTGAAGTAVGYFAEAIGTYSIALGPFSKTGGTATYTIQIGRGTNEDANTFKVGNNNGNFEIMSADGTMPTDRYTTTPSTAGTYVPKLTIAGDGTATREWGPESGGAGGDYLPLSGGTMTGALNFNDNARLNASEATGFTIGLSLGGSLTDMYFFERSTFYPFLNDYVTLGNSSKLWQNVYTTKLNNGADIAVPTTGGTMALKEDIQEALKYISFGDYDESVSIGRGAQNDAGVSIGTNASASDSISIGYDSVSSYKGIAIGDGAEAGAFGIALGGEVVAGDTEFVVGLGGDPIKITDSTGLFPRERMSALVEVLPTAENGYTTVKNYGNGYVEITGYTAIGTVGASTGSEVQIDLPTGYTMANANYWVNIAPTSETTMFDFKAEAKARSTTHFMVAYKNEDTATGLTAAGVYWEVRGMLATE